MRGDYCVFVWIIENTQMNLLWKNRILLAQINWKLEIFFCALIVWLLANPKYPNEVICHCYIAKYCTVALFWYLFVRLKCIHMEFTVRKHWEKVQWQLQQNITKSLVNCVPLICMRDEPQYNFLFSFSSWVGLQ